MQKIIIKCNLINKKIISDDTDCEKISIETFFVQFGLNIM